MLKYSVVKLGQYISEVREQVGSTDGDSFPVYGVTNIDGITITGKESSKDLSKYRRLKSKHFAYNPYRVNVGSVGLANENQNGIVSPAYVVFTTKPDLDHDYLFKYLKSREGHRQINFYGNRGSVRQALRFDDLCKIEIPLPPLEEQRRIVARIEELTAWIEEAKRLRREAVEETEAIVFCALKQFLKPKDGWQVKRISSCSVMKTGTTPPSYRKDYYGGNLQWYTPGDLGFQRKLGRSSRTASDIAIAEEKVRIFEPGTVLLVAIGASLGKVGLTDEYCSSNQQITGIKFSTDILPEYGFWWIRSLYDNLRAAAPQATLQIINQQRIGVFEIGVPPLPDQRRIVDYLDKLQSRIDELRKYQAETQEQVDALSQSILIKAFRDEL